MSRWLTALSMALVASMALPAGALASVDGDLVDWGVSMGPGGHITYDAAYGAAYQPVLGPGVTTSVHNVTIAGGRIVSATVEDSSDESNDYPVGPFWGGQNYDAEFLGLSLSNSGNTLSIALSSGQRPDNGWESPGKGLYGPGDLVIKTIFNTYYGLELGGGPITASPADYTLGADGYTYEVDGSGYTEAWNVPGYMPAGTVGSLWQTSGIGSSDWLAGLGGMATQVVGGTLAGSATAVYANLTGALLDDHAWIEIDIATNLFDSEIDWVRWAPSCANDVLYLTAEMISNPPEVPEPASFVIWGILGSIGLGCARRRRRRRSA